MARTKVIAEIGINHNGDMAIARQLVDIAALAGCDIVKFQKRTIDIVYSQEFLDSSRESPWGSTQRAQKEGLEFGQKEYAEIDSYCKARGIAWTASAWDIEAQKFLQQFKLSYNKVASAMLTNNDLLEEIASEKRMTFISTGMSNYQEIDSAAAVFKKHDCPFELLHCVSTYPMDPADANLKMIKALEKRYNVGVGYSGHESDILLSVCAVALGASSIERHITLDRRMYGSDQKASLEPSELFELVKQIRIIESALGTGEKVLSSAEEETKKKLRAN